MRERIGRAFATRRRRVVAAITVGALAIVAWIPAIVADHYADGPGGAEVERGRVDQGWRFIADAVRESRGAALGHQGAALVHAQRIWTRPSGRAERVDLTYTDGPFTAPAAGAGGSDPGDERRRVEPPSRLGWVVWGHVRGGPEQMIGFLDYRTGRVVWDIRPPLRTGRA